MLSSIKILKNSYCEETDSPDPDDRWDRASTITSHHIEGFEVSNKYFDLETEFYPDFGVDYYLLYAVYSTGDSFGHDDGANIEFLGLYEKYETADLNMKRVETDKEKPMPDASAGTVTLLSDFGIDQYDFYIPWYGYFEGLDYITVEVVRRVT